MTLEELAELGIVPNAQYDDEPRESGYNGGGAFEP
jgi:hypothetical protein